MNTVQNKAKTGILSLPVPLSVCCHPKSFFLISPPLSVSCMLCSYVFTSWGLGLAWHYVPGGVGPLCCKAGLQCALLFSQALPVSVFKREQLFLSVQKEQRLSLFVPVCDSREEAIQSSIYRGGDWHLLNIFSTCWTNWKQPGTSQAVHQEVAASLTNLQL